MPPSSSTICVPALVPADTRPPEAAWFRFGFGLGFGFGFGFGLGSGIGLGRARGRLCGEAVVERRHQLGAAERSHRLARVPVGVRVRVSVHKPD